MPAMTEYDTIVVGSGAGGATVARELAIKGKTVLLLEKGGRVNMMGNTLTMAFILKHFGLVRSREKNVVTIPNNYGGLSTLAAGCAAPPPGIVFDPVGVDLSAEAEKARPEMNIQVQPDELIGKENLRLLEAANDAGYNWRKMEKFIDAAACDGNGNCMLGCHTGAKFSARTFGDEAIRHGATLKLRTHITDVLVENGKAIGVSGSRLGRKVRYHAKHVVLSAGVGNVHILRQSGVKEAGQGFCCDWLQFVGGIIPGMNTSRATPMSVGTLEHYETDGIAILPVFPNWSQFAVMLMFMGWKSLIKFPNFWKYSGIMVKIRDENAGRIYDGMSFSKPVTEQDAKKLKKGVSIIKNILKHAGAREDSIIELKPSGAHPSATCRIGDVVDENLQTRIRNLYCCDASVFPSSLGLPVVWTAVSLGKRLAAHLMSGGEAPEGKDRSN